MKTIPLLCSVFFILSAFTFPMFPQSITGWGVTVSDSAAIASQVNALFGPSFEVGDIVNMDSAKNNLSFAAGAFQDPDNLLEHCYIFTAHNAVFPGLRNVLGIFRNGQIVWNSDTLIASDGSSGDELFGSYDLLGDGKIEIISLWPEGGQSETMWLYKWDGETGVRINALGSRGHSVLFKYDGFDFADVDGDGAWEIQASSGLKTNSNQPSIWTITTYKWNGQYYDAWPGDPGYRQNTFYPRDRVSVTIAATVTQAQSHLWYRYRVENGSSSVQKLSEIILRRRSNNITGISSRKGWSGFNGNGIIDWVCYGPTTGVFLYSTSNLISKGEVDSSFGFYAIGLPCISDYFAQGYNRTPTGYDLNLEYQNAYTNSRSGRTVAAADPPSPFSGFNFLDTLDSYTIQSRSIGWITNDPTANAFVAGFDSAKAQLQRNDTRLARYTLDTVLAHAVQDSTNVLSSEAFALIYYNTQYLLSQLPDSSK